MLKKKIKKLIGYSVILALVAGLLAAGWIAFDFNQFRHSQLSLGHQTVTYVVEPGASLSKLARDLERDGIIKRAIYLIALSRLDGTANKIQAGEYELVPGMTPGQMLRLFVDGEVIQHSFTIIEGWTFKQLLEAVRSNNMFVHDTRGLETDQILKKAGVEESHPEGLFFPETYYFTRGTKESQFLHRAYRVLKEKLDAHWQKRSSDTMVKTPYEALILASIIEKETALDTERTEIAGVFTRRLKKGMRLQTDPTVIYGMGDAYDGDIRFRDLKKDTPYNTYTRKGLPPTPIAMPGEASIQAALNPKPGNTLYFVARGDGSHVFSATLKQHNREVKRFLQRSK